MSAYLISEPDFGNTACARRRYRVFEERGIVGSWSEGGNRRDRSGKLYRRIHLEFSEKLVDMEERRRHFKQREES